MNSKLDIGYLNYHMYNIKYYKDIRFIRKEVNTVIRDVYHVCNKCPIRAIQVKSLFGIVWRPEGYK